jgi:SNF2 family DNA or RNA helicase
LRSKFLLLLTATPVQNSLDDLYHLVTLLRPGQLETPRQFRERFAAQGAGTSVGKKLHVKNPELLRRLTSEVMVRTTRAEAGLDLPPRQARTAIITPTHDEARLYQDASRYLKNLNVNRLRLLSTQRLLGSLPSAALSGLKESDFDINSYDLKVSSKLKYLEGYIRESRERAPDQKILIFTQFTESHAQILKLLSGRYSCASIIGGQDQSTRERETERFKSECSILVSTDAGSEGRNFQFCHSLVNFDIPWNPMRIEQRIGRLHRFGQKEPVEILNLCQKDSVEEALLWLIDQKLNLFELVVGELSSILGDLEDEQSFEQTVGEMWIESPSWDDFRKRMEGLGEQAGTVYQEQLKVRRLDAELFGGSAT